jgi:hypothetical protein
VRPVVEVLPTCKLSQAGKIAQVHVTVSIKVSPLGHDRIAAGQHARSGHANRESPQIRQPDRPVGVQIPKSGTLLLRRRAPNARQHHYNRHPM